MDTTTAWVKPPNQIIGLDHLAVQALCINVYGRLLPGITNVTDRARYYSFYPWLIWQFDQQGLTKFDSKFIDRFRSADCLFTLIAERHAAVSGDQYEDHAGSMVGSNTLSALVKNLTDSEPLRLSDYASQDNTSSRYFKNKLGGLGQYYMGVLRELSVLDGDTANGIRYTREVGQTIAECMEKGVQSDLFFSVLDKGLVNASELDALSSFCPCHLQRNTAEQAILQEIFFARGKYFDEEALPRRRTLQSLIQLSDLLADQGEGLTEQTFRACIYTGALPDGSLWQCPETLFTNRDKWATYARNELLSLSIQGLFYALLDGYEASALRFDTGKQLVDWFLDQPEVTNALSDLGESKTLSEQLLGCEKWLPAIESWDDNRHEIQSAERVVFLSGSKQHVSASTRQEIITRSLEALIALGYRMKDRDNPYGDLVFEEGQFLFYPINLRAFQFHIKNTWADFSMRELLGWLLLRWGVDTHLMVALRKLRGQSQSTFRIRPSEQGLEVIGVPPAVHTTPRFKQALRILKDIGALERTEAGAWVPSAIGKAVVEIGDAP